MKIEAASETAAGFPKPVAAPLQKSNRIFAFSNRDLLVGVLLCGIFIGARLWNLHSYNLWSDEVISLHRARQDWGDLFRMLIHDGFQAPLFYVLLKVWIGIGGESLLWLRLLPVLISILLLIPFFLLCRELNLHAVEAGSALLLMAVNGYLIYYSQELRPYCLFLLLTVSSLVLFIRFLNSGVINKTDLLIMVGVNTLLVYTHYFGWIVIGCEFLFLSLRKRQRLVPFALTAALTFLLFSPWAYVAFVRVTAKPRGVAQTLGWITRPGWSSLISFFSILNGPINFPGGMYVGLVLFGGPVLLWAWHVLRRRAEAEDAGHTNTFWLLSLFSFLPVALVFFVSQVSTQSVWVTRYLIFMAVPYLLLVSIAVYRIRPDWVRTAIVVLIVSWATVAGFKYDQYSVRAIPWEYLVDRVIEADRGEGKGILIIYVYGNRGALLPLQFYLRAANKKEFRVKFVRDFAAIVDEHFWAAVDESSGMQEPLVNDLVKNGYRIGKPFEAGLPGKRLFLFPVWMNKDIRAP